MLPQTILTKIINLPLVKLKYISHAETLFREKQILDITFRGKGKYKQCPCCGQKTKKQQDRGFYIQKDIRHQIHFSYEIRLTILKRRFRCGKCKTPFMEPFDFIPKKINKDKIIGQKDRSKSHTREFENYILFEWHHLTVAEIARRCSVSEYRIWNIIADIDIEDLMQKGIQILLDQPGELILGIDEHSFSGRDMVLVITEHNSKKVVAVLSDTRKETLKKWLNHLPPSVMVRIKGLTNDMTGSYKDAVLESLGSHVVDIVDKYHIIQLANNAVDEVRKMNSWMIHAGIYGHDLIDLRQRKGIKKNKKKDKFKKNHKGYFSPKRVPLLNYKKYRGEINNKDIKLRLYRPEDSNYKAITIQHFLAQTYRTLFLKREDGLSYRQEQRLNQILLEFDPLCHVTEAYTAKEMIHDMMDERSEELLDETISYLKDAEHYKLQELYRTLKRWKPEILNYFKYGKTNARNEGYNNKSKIIKRISYGYNTKKNYIKKLMFAL